MTKNNAETSEKISPFEWTTLKKIVTESCYEVENVFLKKPNLKKSYKYQYLIYSFHLTLAERKEI